MRPGPPVGSRDAVERLPADAGPGERAAHQAIEMRQMGAGRHLRHDAAEALVLGELGQHQARADARVPVAHDRDRGLVAARLDAQNLHGAGP